MFALTLSSPSAFRYCYYNTRMRGQHACIIASLHTHYPQHPHHYHHKHHNCPNPCHNVICCDYDNDDGDDKDGDEADY